MKRLNSLVILLLNLLFLILNTVHAENYAGNSPISIKSMKISYPVPIHQQLPTIILKKKPTEIKVKLTGICNNRFCFFTAKFKNTENVSIKINDLSLNSANDGSYQGSVPVVPGQKLKIILTFNGLTKKLTMNVPSLNKNFKFNNSPQMTRLKDWLQNETDETTEELNLSWHEQTKSDYYLFHKKFTDHRKNLIAAYHFKTYTNSIYLKRSDTLDELNRSQASNLYLWASPVNEYQLNEFASGSEIIIEGFPSECLSN